MQDIEMLGTFISFKRRMLSRRSQIGSKTLPFPSNSAELKKLILYDKMLEYFDKRLNSKNSTFENKGLLTVYQKLTSLK